MQDPNLGWVSKNKNKAIVAGTYLHSIFDNGAWRRAWLNQIRKKKNLVKLPINISNHSEKREYLIDLLADTFNKYVDLEPVLKE